MPLSIEHQRLVAHVRWVFENNFAIIGQNFRCSEDKKIVVIGEPRANLGNGAVHIYQVEGDFLPQRYTERDDWNYCGTIRPEDSTVVKWFGGSVAISGDATIIAVGEIMGDSVHVFLRTADVFTKLAVLTAGEEANDWAFCFGLSVSPDGRTVKVKASGGQPFSRCSTKDFVFVQTGDTWTRKS